jgi:hypothetical protein
MLTFTKITQWFKTVFAADTYTSTIDAYIASKNPTTAAEVDYWIKSYDQRLNQGNYLWKS